MAVQVTLDGAGGSVEGAVERLETGEAELLVMDGKQGEAVRGRVMEMGGAEAVLGSRAVGVAAPVFALQRATARRRPRCRACPCPARSSSARCGSRSARFTGPTRPQHPRVHRPVDRWRCRKTLPYTAGAESGDIAAVSLRLPRFANLRACPLGSW